MAWAGEGYEVDFCKVCWILVGRFSENDFFHERGRRGRSRRENSGKLFAAAFSRCDFPMARGLKNREKPRKAEIAV